MHMTREEAFILNGICAWLVSGWIVVAAYLISVHASLPLIGFFASVPTIAIMFCIHLIREGVTYE